MEDMDKTTEIILTDNTISEATSNVKRKKRNYTVRNNKFLTPDLLDTPIYNDELMENVLVGIAQNIWVEMDRQGFSIRGLANLSDVNYSQI